MAGRNIGALWKTKEGSKAALSGSFDLAGVRIRIAIFKNDRDDAKPNSPQYSIVSYGIDDKQQDSSGQQTAQDDMPF